VATTARPTVFFAAAIILGRISVTDSVAPICFVHQTNDALRLARRSRRTRVRWRSPRGRCSAWSPSGNERSKRLRTKRSAWSTRANGNWMSSWTRICASKSGNRSNCKRELCSCVLEDLRIEYKPLGAGAFLVVDQVVTQSLTWHLEEGYTWRWLVHRFLASVAVASHSQVNKIGFVWVL